MFVVNNKWIVVSCAYDFEGFSFCTSKLSLTTPMKIYFFRLILFASYFICFILYFSQFQLETNIKNKDA